MRSVLLVAFLLLWSNQAQAVTIALLRPSSASPEVTEALFRLQGELLAVKLEVEIANPPPGLRTDTIEMNAWFERMATERGIDAIIDVVGDPIPVGADIWIFQQLSQTFRASRVVLEPDTVNPPETLAIRAIEVLRANFLVIDLAGSEPPPSPVTEPTSEEPPETPEAVGPFGLAAGAAVLTSLDGVGPALLPRMRFDWLLASELAAEATLCGFGTRPTVETEAGGVRVAQHYAVLGLRYSTPSDSALGAFLGLGGGVMQTTLAGWADAPNRGHRLGKWAFLMEGTLGATLKLSERYHLTLAAHIQFATPYVAIHFVDTEVATTGRPNVLASLTLGAWL